jgi:ribosomal protein L7/L12
MLVTRAEVVEAEVSSRHVVLRQAGSSMPKVKATKRKRNIQKLSLWTAPIALMYR